MLFSPEETPRPCIDACVSPSACVYLRSNVDLISLMTSRKRAWSFARSISQHGEGVGAAPSSPGSLGLRALHQELVFSEDPPRARARQPAPPRARSQSLHHACPSAVGSSNRGARRWWSPAVVDRSGRSKAEDMPVLHLASSSGFRSSAAMLHRRTWPSRLNAGNTGHTGPFHSLGALAHR